MPSSDALKKVLAKGFKSILPQAFSKCFPLEFKTLFIRMVEIIDIPNNFS